MASHENIDALCPLLEEKFRREMMTESKDLRLVIREYDFDYQVRRGSYLRKAFHKTNTATDEM